MLFSHGSFGCVSFLWEVFSPFRVGLVQMSFSFLFFSREMSCQSVLVLKQKGFFLAFLSQRRACTFRFLRVLFCCLVASVEVLLLVSSLCFPSPSLHRISRSRLGEKNKGYQNRGDLQGLGLRSSSSQRRSWFRGGPLGRDPRGLSWEGYDSCRRPSRADGFCGCHLVTACWVSEQLVSDLSGAVFLPEKERNAARNS